MTSVAKVSLLLFVVVLTACAGSQSRMDGTAGKPQVKQVQAWADAMLIVDTHIDVPHRVFDEYVDVSNATTGGDFDYPRARKGGLNAAFMSIYVPADLEATPGASYARAEILIDQIQKLVERAPQKFAIATSVADVREHKLSGLISLPMGMENGAPIEGDLNNLQHFYDRGIRYITLAHSLSNHISDSSYDENRPWQGLSPFGRQVVKHMNDLGMMIDVSHLSDQAFYEVLQVSESPVIASHSSARYFTPGFERNMDDDMIRALAAHGGVIQINYGSGFLTQQARDSYQAYRDARDAHFGEGTSPDEQALQAFTQAYRAKIPYAFADIQDVVAHILHVIDLVGVETRRDRIRFRWRR